MCVACQEFTIAPRQGVAYCLTSLAGTLQQQPTSACSALALADACAALPEASHVYQLGPRQR